MNWLVTGYVGNWQKYQEFNETQVGDLYIWVVGVNKLNYLYYIWRNYVNNFECK